MRPLLTLLLAAMANTADISISRWNGMLLVTAPAGSRLDQLGGCLAQRITLDARDQPLTDVADLLRGMTGLNLVLTPGLLSHPPRITLQVRDMALGHVLTWIARVGGVHIGYVDGALYIAEQPIAGPASTRLYDVSDLSLPRRDFPGPHLTLDRAATGPASATSVAAPAYDVDMLIDMLNRRDFNKIHVNSTNNK